MPKGYTYILLCEGDNLYTGSTRNIRRRFAQHLHGQGANFTRKHKPIKIVYLEEHGRIDHAFYREKQIQRWSRGKKDALIHGDENLLHALAACRNWSHYLRSPLDLLRFHSAQVARGSLAESKVRGG
jgi:putative endonuclease